MDIPKPPEDLETRNIIEKLAQFVARNGPQFEQMTKNKQSGNPKFQFLFGGDYHEYYRYCVATERNNNNFEIMNQNPNQPPPPPQQMPMHHHPSFGPPPPQSFHGPPMHHGPPPGPPPPHFLPPHPDNNGYHHPPPHHHPHHHPPPHLPPPHHLVEEPPPPFHPNNNSQYMPPHPHPHPHPPHHLHNQRPPMNPPGGLPPPPPTIIHQTQQPRPPQPPPQPPQQQQPPANWVTNPNPPSITQQQQPPPQQQDSSNNDNPNTNNTNNDTTQLDSQINQLENHIKESEKNLSEHQKIIENDKLKEIDNLLKKLFDDELKRMCEDFNINLMDFDKILQPIIDTCRKESIAKGKIWIFNNCFQSEHYDAVAKHLLKRVSNSDTTIDGKLHIMYLINDLFNHCMRKNDEKLKTSLIKIIVPSFSYVMMETNEENKQKMNKLLKIWKMNQYLDEKILDQLMTPKESLDVYKTSLRQQYSEQIKSIEQLHKDKFEKIEKQHTDFVSHCQAQIQQLQNQKKTLQANPIRPPFPPTNVFVPPPTTIPGQFPGAGPGPMPPMSHGQPPLPPNQHQMLPTPPGISGNPPGGPPQPPPQSLPPPTSLPYTSQAPNNFVGNQIMAAATAGTSLASSTMHLQMPPLFQTSPSLPPPPQPPSNNFYPPVSGGYPLPPATPQMMQPLMNMPPVSGPGGPLIHPAAAGLAPQPQMFVPPPQSMIPPIAQKPPEEQQTPYFERPAGIMTQLIKLEDFDYSPIDPNQIKMPPLLPPSERLLKALEEFYAPPGRNNPRNSDGWEKLALHDFFKAKSQARKELENNNGNESKDNESFLHNQDSDSSNLQPPSITQSYGNDMDNTNSNSEHPKQSPKRSFKEFKEEKSPNRRSRSRSSEKDRHHHHKSSNHNHHHHKHKRSRSKSSLSSRSRSRSPKSYKKGSSKHSRRKSSSSSSRSSSSSPESKRFHSNNHHKNDKNNHNKRNNDHSKKESSSSSTSKMMTWSSNTGFTVKDKNKDRDLPSSMISTPPKTISIKTNFSSENQYQGFGSQTPSSSNVNDPFESFRRNKGQAYIQRIRERNCN